MNTFSFSAAAPVSGPGGGPGGGGEDPPKDEKDQKIETLKAKNKQLRNENKDLNAAIDELERKLKASMALHPETAPPTVLNQLQVNKLDDQINFYYLLLIVFVYRPQGPDF